jgi:hypothetical protein
MRILEQSTAGELVNYFQKGFQGNVSSRSEVAIVEFEPQIRMIKLVVKDKDIDLDYDIDLPVGNGRYIHTLAFPYMQFAYCEQFLAVGMRNKPATNFRDPLFLPTLPNIYVTGQICQPSSESLEKAIDVFWQSVFQVDGNWRGVVSLLKSEFKWYDNWEELTRNNPEQALKYQWDEKLLCKEDVEEFIITRSRWTFAGGANGDQMDDE